MPTNQSAQQRKTTTDEPVPFGTAPRPKYEVPLSKRPEVSQDEHSRSDQAESPYLGDDLVPGSAG